MYWIKKAFLICSLVVFFNGCYSGIANSIAVSTNLLPDPSKGKVYLEKFDNDKFLEYILENNYIVGLKKDDVVYIDNGIAHQHLSSKLIFTKKYFYNIISKKDLDKLDKYKLNDLYIEISQYLTKDIYLNSKIYNEHTLSKYLRIYKVKNTPKWYELKRKLFMRIDTRYNNIYKIKEIIDERVAYHKKNRTYDED